MTNEHIRSKRRSQTAIAAELVVEHDGKGHRRLAYTVMAKNIQLFFPKKWWLFNDGLTVTQILAVYVELYKLCSCEAT